LAQRSLEQVQPTLIVQSLGDELPLHCRRYKISFAERSVSSSGLSVSVNILKRGHISSSTSFCSSSSFRGKSWIKRPPERFHWLLVQYVLGFALTNHNIALDNR
jgi:hypothetical protein